MWIRTILFELSRIANVSLFIGDLALQLGAQTPAFYAFRDREFVLNQIESVTGGRFHPNFDRIGGLKDDLPKGWIAETKAAMVRLRGFCDEMEGLVYGNEIFQSRTRGIGIIPAHVALSYGLSGANLRGSGRRLGPPPRRQRRPRLRPARLEGVDPPRRRQLRPLLGAAAGGPRGHHASSTSCCDGLPAGPIMAKVPRIIKVPEGEAYVATENPLGAMGYYVVSQGRHRPVPGEDPLGQLQQHLRRARGCSGASTCPTSSRSSPASTSSWGTSTADGRLRPRPRAVLLAADDRCASSACWWRCSCPPAPSSTSSSSR